MSLNKNLVGQTFGRLYVIEYWKNIKGRKFWKCRCECNNILYVNTSHLVSGHTKSCGCLKKEVLSKPFGDAAFTSLYNGYKNSAKRRNLVFSLTKDDFKLLINQTCFYCGEKPEKYYIHSDGNNGGILYNGIDRKDNSRGYVLDNCVPCCDFCNKSKRNLPYDIFIKYLDRITKFRC